MRAAIVGHDNSPSSAITCTCPPMQKRDFNRSVLLSRTAASCGFPYLERVFYFRGAGFFRGADFLRGAPFGGLSASLTALPAWNRTALLEQLGRVQHPRTRAWLRAIATRTKSWVGYSKPAVGASAETLGGTIRALSRLGRQGRRVTGLCAHPIDQGALAGLAS